MARAGMGAGNEGVEPLDLVHETIFHKKIQRTVCHGRLAAEPGIAQPVQQLVRAQRTMFAQEDFERRAAHRCKAQSRGGAMRLGCGNGGLDTYIVIMRDEPDRCGQVFA